MRQNKIDGFTWADQDRIGPMIFKNFADQDWIGFNFCGSGLDTDWKISLFAHLWTASSWYCSEVRCVTLIYDYQLILYKYCTSIGPVNTTHWLLSSAPNLSFTYLYLKMVLSMRLWSSTLWILFLVY